MTGLAAEVIERAAARRAHVATAESCTGGLVAGALTGVPGASAVLTHGVVAYANAAKIGLLGVDAGLIERHGAVSGEVAGAMAAGMARVSGAELAVSITGIAGPGGGSLAKPVGLVWFGLSAFGAVRTAREVFGGLDRDGVRQAAVEFALTMLRDALGDG